MAAKRSKGGLNVVKVMWAAVLLLATVINYFAISLLSSYEKNVAHGLRNLESSNSMLVPSKKMPPHSSKSIDRSTKTGKTLARGLREPTERMKKVPTPTKSTAHSTKNTKNEKPAHVLPKQQQAAQTKKRPTPLEKALMPQTLQLPPEEPFKKEDTSKRKESIYKAQPQQTKSKSTSKKPTKKVEPVKLQLPQVINKPKESIYKAQPQQTKSKPTSKNPTKKAEPVTKDAPAAKLLEKQGISQAKDSSVNKAAHQKTKTKEKTLKDQRKAESKPPNTSGKSTKIKGVTKDTAAKKPLKQRGTSKVALNKPTKQQTNPAIKEKTVKDQQTKSKPPNTSGRSAKQQVTKAGTNDSEAPAKKPLEQQRTPKANDSSLNKTTKQHTKPTNKATSLKDQQTQSKPPKTSRKPTKQQATTKDAPDDKPLEQQRTPKMINESDLNKPAKQQTKPKSKEAILKDPQMKSKPQKVEKPAKEQAKAVTNDAAAVKPLKQKQKSTPKTNNESALNKPTKQQTKPTSKEATLKDQQLKSKPPKAGKPAKEQVKAVTNDTAAVKPLKQKQQSTPKTNDSTLKKHTKQQTKPVDKVPKKQTEAPDDEESSTEQLNGLSYYMALSRAERHDKEKILHLLRDNAKIHAISDETYKELPSWSQLTALYGNKPRFVDQEQCKVFRSQGDLADKLIGVAGTFNTGTNILFDTLFENCALHKRQEKYGKKNVGIMSQVTYGKHVPPKDREFRASHLAKTGRENIDPRNVLPVVMVRDPFRWLQSMCLNYYTSRWPRVYRPTDPRYHCPNLFPTEAEKRKLRETGFKPLLDGSEMVKETPGTGHLGNGVFVDKQTHKERLLPQVTQNPEDFTAKEPSSTLTEEELELHHFPIMVGYSNFTQHHYSLVHLWNEWLQNYRKLEGYPHIFVRFEDLLYFPDEVITHVCECGGGKLFHRNETTGKPLPVQVSSQSQKLSAESHVVGKGKLKHTGYLDALIRYAKSSTRFRGMTPHDLQYARRYFDKELMDLFHYSLPPGPAVQPDS